MAYRKFRADQLFTGQEMAGEDAVLVMDEEGRVQTILPLAEAGDGVEQLRGILSPGFINCHCHLELSHMKGILPEKTGLVDFLLGVLRSRGTGSSGTRQGSGTGRIRFHGACGVVHPLLTVHRRNGSQLSRRLATLLQALVTD